MKYLILIALLLLSLSACTSPNDSVIVEIRSSGVYSGGAIINKLDVFFNKIENQNSKNVVFIVNSDAPSNALRKAIIVSEKFEFKSVSITSL